jgi:hypothetical protein
MVRGPGCASIPTSLLYTTYVGSGDVVYLEALGQPIVILGSMQAAADMFEKNGVNVSDRPQSVCAPTAYRPMKVG